MDSVLDLIPKFFSPCYWNLPLQSTLSRTDTAGTLCWRSCLFQFTAFKHEIDEIHRRKYFLALVSSTALSREMWKSSGSLWLSNQTLLQAWYCQSCSDSFVIVWSGEETQLAFLYILVDPGDLTGRNLVSVIGLSQYDFRRPGNRCRRLKIASLSSFSVCPHFYPYELQVRTCLLNQMALLDYLLSDQKIMILTVILPVHTLPKKKLC